MQRELTAAEMDALLESQVTGHLACQSGGRPYIIPLAYYHRDGVLYGQTMEGKKTEILRQHPDVCFQVQALGSDGWESVVCWGKFEEVDLSAPLAPELLESLAGLVARLGVVQQSVGVKVEFDASRSLPIVGQGHGTIFRIQITERTGRAFTADR